MQALLRAEGCCIITGDATVQVLQELLDLLEMRRVMPLLTNLCGFVGRGM